MFVLVLALASVSAGSEQFNLRKCCDFNKVFNASTNRCSFHKNGESSMKVFQDELLKFNANLVSNTWTPSKDTVCLPDYSATLATDGWHFGEDGVLVDPEFGRIPADRFCLEVATDNFTEYEVLTLVCEASSPGESKKVYDLGRYQFFTFLSQFCG